MNEVKRSKPDLHMNQYEFFQMKFKKSIQEMSTCFTNIINELIFLGKLISSEDKSMKGPKESS